MFPSMTILLCLSTVYSSVSPPRQDTSYQDTHLSLQHDSVLNSLSPADISFVDLPGTTERLQWYREVERFTAEFEEQLGRRPRHCPRPPIPRFLPTSPINAWMVRDSSGLNGLDRWYEAVDVLVKRPRGCPRPRNPVIPTGETAEVVDSAVSEFLRSVEWFKRELDSAYVVDEIPYLFYKVGVELYRGGRRYHEEFVSDSALQNSSLRRWR